jgi:2-polyprenyl-3-methyl-5-hydroxy-6-metoxy-1,4-benzoquinol methylase
MEIRENLELTNSGSLNPATTYLQRQKCPGCFTSSAKARPEIKSLPPAEDLSLDQHGKFLSGYTNHRVFFTYYRCSCCNLLYCPTYFAQEQLNSLYKNQSENMAEVPLAARASTQKAYYQLLKKFHSPDGDYLEIGADIGLFAKFFAENSKIDQLFLYEPNHEVHETLKANLANKKYKILTKNYSASDLGAGQLSTAVIIHALDHILDPRHLIRDLHQNLKPGGVIFIVTHDESSLLAKALGKKWPPYTLQHPQLFQPATIQSLLIAEGFNILASKKTANYFPLTHFIKGGLTALGLNKLPIPDVSKLILPIKLGNIATIAQKPWGDRQ